MYKLLVLDRNIWNHNCVQRNDNKLKAIFKECNEYWNYNYNCNQTFWNESNFGIK